MVTKVCTKCHQEKDENEFYNTSTPTKKTTKQSWCKQCTIAWKKPPVKSWGKPDLYSSRKPAPTQYSSINDIRDQGLRKKSACKILKHHHETTKKDPDHLTTRFLENLIQKKCKKVK